MSCRESLTSLTYFRFMANLERWGNRIPVEWPLKPTLPLTVTFHIRKTENRTKKSLT